MRLIDLRDLNIDDPIETDSVFIRVENYISIEKLVWLNELSLKGVNVKLNLCFSEFWTLDILEFIKDVPDLILNPSFEFPLENLESLVVMNNLRLLELGNYTKKSISLKPLSDKMTVVHFKFLDGLFSKSQYDFVNNQHSLKSLHVKSLNLDLVEKNLLIESFRIDGVLKNQDLIGLKFPNLRKLHIHNAANFNDFDFLKGLFSLKSLSIYNSNKLTVFPELGSYATIRSISVYNCPNLECVSSILFCSNLESLEIISRMKKSKLSLDVFEGFKSFKKFVID